jgi:hypothetical protein
VREREVTLSKSTAPSERGQEEPQPPEDDDQDDQYDEPARGAVGTFRLIVARPWRGISHRGHALLVPQSASVSVTRSGLDPQGEEAEVDPKAGEYDDNDYDDRDRSQPSPTAIGLRVPASHPRSSLPPSASVNVTSRRFPNGWKNTHANAEIAAASVTAGVIPGGTPGGC